MFSAADLIGKEVGIVLGHVGFCMRFCFETAALVPPKYQLKYVQLSLLNRSTGLI
jgi:hypothetical protein